MGSSPRLKPKHLGRKLRILRLDILGMSQTEMSRALGLKVDYSVVSQYELGKREPSLMILLKYARLGGVTMEQLVDDKLNLPK